MYPYCHILASRIYYLNVFVCNILHTTEYFTQTNNVGTNFFPGQASLAYFFFFGSVMLLVLVVSAGSSGCGITGWAGAISTSGAGFGNDRPNRDASAEEKSNVFAVFWCISGPIHTN